MCLTLCCSLLGITVITLNEIYMVLLSTQHYALNSFSEENMYIYVKHIVEMVTMGNNVTSSRKRFFFPWRKNERISVGLQAVN